MIGRLDIDEGGCDMKWKKLKPIKGGHGGCGNCGFIYNIAPMEMIIAVGFGYAAVEKNGVAIYDENTCENTWNVQIAEDEARKDPDNDWRIIMDGPLSGRTYQRHDNGTWVLVRKNRGFA